MLKSAGSETMRENNRVRSPFADLISRSTRPTLNTRTMRTRVGGMIIASFAHSASNTSVTPTFIFNQFKTSPRSQGSLLTAISTIYTFHLIDLFHQKHTTGHTTENGK